ncbi:MAG: DNA-binding transcriptional repressor ArsR [Euryarchaeota archaeon ADurb.Bin294]|jgi:ArsR family transcriptional regulator|uniref:ArsR/SmtB family transcription factor n=1 Tax=Methanospirillum sp. TaxID=45200 RepID=UPI0009C9DE8A|nr:metalloregulator ArsR/SmtB family transcription factor [Methanospirillum sp.]OQA55618.1 MAG: DNA-binding transcriptional repressor ArsR [Euryarchaeota archaeon ADurb.Bin294]HPY61371.1 metalloregulator ArsR/SmtB family transcription factor [Methanospirillum sp.]
MGLPEPIEETLDQIGGVDGLRQYLPPDKELLRKKSVFTALSDTTRLQILYLLNIQPLCVCVIKEVIDIADSKLSYHLKTLTVAGLIEKEAEGIFLIYSITQMGKRCIQIWV